jgi:SNF2-related domain
MIEGASNQNEDVVNRLHGIIRPFILRRLKKDVETQMPGKFEHIVKCQLSRRQVGYFQCLIHFHPGIVLTFFVYVDVHLRRVHGAIVNTSGLKARS